MAGLWRRLALQAALLFLTADNVSSQGPCDCPVPIPDPDGNYIVPCICDGILQASWSVDEPQIDDMVAIYRCSDAEIDFVTQPLTFLWACGNGFCLAESGTLVFDTDPGLTFSPDFKWPIPTCECLFVVYQRGDVEGESPPPYSFVVQGDNFILPGDGAECPTEPDETPPPPPYVPTPPPTPYVAPTRAPVPLPVPDDTPKPVPNPGQPQCEDLDNCYPRCGLGPCKTPSQIIFRYTGKSCSNPLNNNPQGGYFTCKDRGNIENSNVPKTIKFIDHNGATIGKALNVDVGDCVSAGSYNGKVDCVTLDPITDSRRQLDITESSIGQPGHGTRHLTNNNNNGNCVYRFSRDTIILIKDDSSVLQRLSIRTSCAKGLRVGEVYSSLTVKYLLFDLAA